PYSAIYREVGPSDAERIWLAVRAGQPAEITIPPEWVYRGAAETFSGLLSCDRVVPVIRTMGLVVADDGGASNSALNTQPGINAQVFSSPEVAFATSAGPEPFVGQLPSWLSFSPRVIYGPVADAYTLYTTKPSAQQPASNTGASQG